MIILLIFTIISLSLTMFDYNGIIGTGQSLAVGGMSELNYISTQPFNNLKISLGNEGESWPLDFNDPNSQFSLVALVEPIRPLATTYPSPYPKNICGETPHSAMANQITTLQSGLVTIHTVVGEGGQGMEMIRKGAVDDNTTGRAYEASMFEIKAISRLAEIVNKSYGVNAIILTHGEADSWNDIYRNQLVELYRNYTEDVRNITGQTEDVVLIVSQQHGAGGPRYPPNGATQAQWTAQEDVPGGIICSGPKYQYEYNSDGLHMTDSSYDELGEKYGEVYNEVVVKGNHAWRPLQPISVYRFNKTAVNVTFHVPNLPLRWDNSLPEPYVDEQWKTGHGFELEQYWNDVPVPISKVEISASSVLINSPKTLPTEQLKVGYAATGLPELPPPEGEENPIPQFRPGGTVRWGLLTDSDQTVGYKSKKRLYNWAVAFQINVPDGSGPGPEPETELQPGSSSSTVTTFSTLFLLIAAIWTFFF